MSEFIFRPRLACAAVLLVLSFAGPAAAQYTSAGLLAQGYPADGCMPRREAIAAVASGRVLPLRQVRGTAEEAAKGEMINAELCTKDGATVYVVTVLSTSGKVVYVTLNAASGQLVNLR
jgi:hypothetical protein